MSGMRTKPGMSRTAPSDPARNPKGCSSRKTPIRLIRWQVNADSGKLMIFSTRMPSTSSYSRSVRS